VPHRRGVAVDAGKELVGRLPAEGADVLAHDGQRRLHEICEREVVEPHDGHLV